ncbi:MAG: nitroreductase family deazaflavin-dependent oxidoreductase [Oscillochloris sp.]|nr:nitroreductase family deazaflavin-dependent oxidoreductase [Oscillochloris sp.]
MRYRISGIRQMLLWLASTRLGAWVVLHVFTPLDQVLLRVSRGRFSTTAVFLPSLMLISMGAKSGQPRATPLVYISDGEHIVLIASNGGMPRHPAWYHNLRANPLVRVIANRQSGNYRAYEAQGVEREDLWRHALEAYPGFAVYQSRTQGRIIPVMVLEPID